MEEENEMIMPLDWKLEDYELHAEEMGETLDEDVIVWEIPDIRNYGGNDVYGTLNGYVWSKEENYINQLVENDMEIEINVPESDDTANEEYAYQRNDNDLELTSISISSKENDTILIKNQENDSVMASLISEIHKKMNYNFNANTVNQSIYELRDDLANFHNNNNAAHTEEYQMTFNLQEYFGDESYFSKYTYLDKEQIEYRLTFTENWTRIAESANASNLDNVNFALLDTSVVNGNRLPVSVIITQRVFRLPSKLEEMFRENQFFIAYEVLNRVYPENIERFNLPLANEHIEFELILTEVDWEEQLEALAICHLHEGIKKLITTNGELKEYTSNNFAKVVPNNLFRYLELLEIYLGSTLLEDMTNNSEIMNYFKKHLKHSIIQEDISEACIYIPINKILQAVTEDQKELRFKFVMKFKDGVDAGYIFEEDGSDLEIFCISVNSIKLKNGKIVNRNSE